MTRPRLRLAGGAALATLLLACAAAPAHAVSRKQAAATAIAHFKPAKQRFPANTVVFGLPRALRAGSTVVDAGPPPGKASAARRTRKLSRAAFLFWEDLFYPAKFLHPSRAVLVDAASGKIVRRMRLQWWPLVNGRDPAFITRRGPSDKRFRVYSRYVDPPAQAAEVLGDPAARMSSALGPTAFSDTCVVAISSKEYGQDPTAVIDYFKAHGAKTYGLSDIPAESNPNAGTKKTGTPDGGAIQEFLQSIAPKCPDIVIYISGHGDSESVALGKKTVVKKFKGQTVVVAEELAQIAPKDLVTAIKNSPRTTFKLIVDACKSGYFIDGPDGVKTAGLTNVLVATTATGRGLLDYTVGWPGSVSNFTAKFLEEAKKSEDAVAADTSGVSKAARLIEQAGTNSTGADFLKHFGISQRSIFSQMPPIGTQPPPDPAPPPPSNEPPPTIKPIQAEFVEGVTYTQYDVTVETSRGTIDYAWSLTPPADDPGCNKIEQLAAPRYARWHHGTADGCTHMGTSHNGVVKVVATVHWPEVPRDWVCTATYNGTLSGTGPQPEPCVAK